MKKFIFSLFIIISNISSVYANDPVIITDSAWKLCQIDSDCMVMGNCCTDYDSVNRIYEQEWKKENFQPSAICKKEYKISKCLKNTCILSKVIEKDYKNKEKILREQNKSESMKYSPEEWAACIKKTQEYSYNQLSRMNPPPDEWTTCQKNEDCVPTGTECCVQDHVVNQNFLSQWEKRYNLNEECKYTLCGITITETKCVQHKCTIKVKNPGLKNK